MIAFSVGAAPNEYQSPQQAFDQGIAAFDGGYYEIAIPALEHAAKAKLFLALLPREDLLRQQRLA